MPQTFTGPLASISDEENKSRKESGQQYYAFRPHLVEERRRCLNAKYAFNDLRDVGRRKRVAAWRAITNDPNPLPPPDPDPSKDEALFDDTDPIVEGPINCDYGYNLKFAPGCYVNAGGCFIDTTPIHIGARTLLGPNVHLYSGTHPLSPSVRAGLQGPESGAPITISADCWIGGNVTVLPGVTIGRGSTVGAGSVVTKDVGEFCVVAGNPARVLRRVVDELEREVVEEEGAQGKGGGGEYA